MFKVLVIAYYFPPLGLSGVQRTVKFVKYLPSNNWSPTVLTCGDIAYYSYDNDLLDEVTNNDIKIVRVSGKEINSRLRKKGITKMPSEFIRKLLNRLSQTFFIPDNKIGWSKKAIITARQLLKSEKFDEIFVTAPPFSSFQMACKLKKEFNLPLIVDYRDLWFGNHFSFYPTPFHSLLHKRMEYKSLKTADKVITINRRMKEKLIETYKFLTFKDVYIIPQGFDPADFDGIVSEKKLKSKMIIIYSGTFYEFITPKFFLKAFKLLTIERPEIAANIELHFTGFLRKENRRLIKKLSLQEYVTENGYLSHRTSLIKTMSSDILWLMIGNGKNADTVSTGKAFEYFGTRKPVIACVPDGSLRNSLEEYGAAFITDPDNIEQIKNTIVKVYELYIKNNLPVPNEEFILNLRRDYLTELLTKQMQFLLRS